MALDPHREAATLIRPDHMAVVATGATSDIVVVKEATCRMETDVPPHFPSGPVDARSLIPLVSVPLRRSVQYPAGGLLACITVGCSV